ncbi:hypothetical protein E2C01_065322 [Portunus trituberculatus]|nr:hypothetical protein [Portunus trituberculatus]
MQKYQKF